MFIIKIWGLKKKKSYSASRQESHFKMFTLWCSLSTLKDGIECKKWASFWNHLMLFVANFACWLRILVLGDAEPRGSCGLCPQPRWVCDCRTCRRNQDLQPLSRKATDCKYTQFAARRWPAGTQWAHGSNPYSAVGLYLHTTAQTVSQSH